VPRVVVTKSLDVVVPFVGACRWSSARFITATPTIVSQKTTQSDMSAAYQ
jgi:hypothetical protein